MFFTNFFCIFQCFAYSKSSYSNPEFNWTMYTAMPITFTLLVLNFVFWKIVQPQLRRQKEKEEQGLMEKLLDEKPDKTRDEYVVSYAKEVVNEYKEGYSRFLESIKNQRLEEEVDDYLASLTAEHLPDTDEGLKIEKLIEMAESEFDEATD